ncbi:MAG: alkaline phosphatase, partial [Thermodesulfovibrionales bacterium]|nr:alkaline phosphatase [Thermodesulfovibrionales bacterium]
MKTISIGKKIVSLLVVLVILVAWSCNSYGKDRSSIKHIILFIGDGMHLEHERATSRYLYGKDFNLIWHNFKYQVPVATWDVTTYNNYANLIGAPPYHPQNIYPSIGYDVTRGGKRPYPLDKNIDDNYFLLPTTFATDSASAGTAISTGYKMDDGNIAWLPSDPPDGKLETIAELLRRYRGFAIGVVSTVPFTHATPASFVSHNVHRNNYFQIADEIIRSIKPEVVIGGGHPTWNNRFMSATLYN